MDKKFNKKEYNKIYMEKYREIHKEERRKYAQEYDKKNIKQKKENIKLWCQNNPDYHRNYKANRKLVDPLYKITCSIRSVVSNSLRRKGLRKSLKTEQILGCTILFFKDHISKQFKEGMSWDNYGEWEIDHIIPIIFANNKEEVIKLCHFSNLQPLWKSENIEKGCKL